jgi:regulator of sigma E protease
MHMGPVQVIRAKSPADGHVFGARDKLEGDLIEEVSVKDADGKDLVFKDKSLDPERLPFDLKQWSARLDKKGVPAKDRTVTLKLRRHQKIGTQQYASESVTLPWDNDWQFDHIVPLSINAPITIPELGIGYQIKSIVRDTHDDSPFQKGDVILNYRFTIQDPKEEESTNWLKREIEEGQWANVGFRLFENNGFRFRKLEFKVKRDGEVKEIEVPLKVDETWPLMERGWILSADMRRVKASGPIDAVRMGLADTHNRMTEIFLNLRGMVLRRIDLDNLGGPITILYGTRRFASMDWGEFVFFLGLISINLAVVNFLPIPILDGGHMVFLIYEWIRRKPASEAVRVWATYAGLAMVLCLMIFVLSLDINRFWLHW